MVRLSSFLYRVPVIKFKKGGLANAGAQSAAPATQGSCPSPQASAGAQQSARMSTISDTELPARYRRQPLSQEEIDCINGGGVI